jgi:hypothetical protein
MGMIFELRTYRVAPGRMPDLLRRFEDHVLSAWERAGVKPLGFWTTMIGASHLDLFYMLQWESLAEREKKWASFNADQQWQEARVASERDGVLVSSAANSILAPTSFSPLQ